MAQSNPESTAITDMFKQTRQFFAFNPMAAPQVEHFWEAQENLLNEAESYAQHWFERRHKATRSALDVTRAVTEQSRADPSAAMKAISEWQAGSMERVAEDFKQWFDFCSVCAGHISQSEKEAGVEGLKKIAQSAASGKRKTDNVPV